MIKNRGLESVMKDAAAAMFLWLMTYAVFLSIPSARAEACNEDVIDVVESIDWLLKPAPKRQLARKPEKKRQLANDIISAAAEWDVPPLLLTVIAFCESSFRTHALGRLGEKGLTQVHGMASKGCVLDNQRGQLSCGARWLARSKRICKDWKGAISAYACGSCNPSSERVKRIVKARISLWQQLQQL
ncbi:MAG: lytic transglycosylase domain-containing protein [Proteobacteria bacterium]|nr:lytic transglycosylase domain-containing protein [Pseudomonadota bacterium]